MLLFISRPNLPEPNYKDGVARFLSFLKSERIDGITLGATSGANLSPIKEVMKLVDSCTGVVVLGMPQIRLKVGTLKGVHVASLVLPTEWNHIEASIGLARGKSLFVVRDQSITVRGALDDGAVGQYVQVVDGKNKNWSGNKTFRSAFRTWTEQIALHNYGDISHLEISILLRLRNLGATQHNYLKLFFQSSSTADFREALEFLKEMKYVKILSQGKIITKNEYSLTSKGLDVLEGYSILGVHQ